VVVRARVASSPFSLPRTLVIKHYAAGPRASGVRPRRAHSDSSRANTGSSR
jgi:hypothetical protein